MGTGTIIEDLTLRDNGIGLPGVSNPGALGVTKYVTA